MKETGAGAQAAQQGGRGGAGEVGPASGRTGPGCFSRCTTKREEGNPSISRLLTKLLTKNLLTKISCVDFLIHTNQLLKNRFVTENLYADWVFVLFLQVR